jgi:Tol biopolymer transport system component
MRNRTRRVARALLIVAVTLATTSSATAQYFGQNKVRYEDFDFKVLKTESFDIYHYLEGEPAIAEAARLAERWNSRLSTLLQHRLSSRQPLILYANHPHFEQTNAIQGSIGESTGGVTEALRRRIVLPFSAGMADTSHVIGHELVHAYQFDLAANTQTRGLNLPLWFVEGMAEYLSIGPQDAHTAMWLRDALLHERLPRIDQLDDPRFFPYRFGHALWAYLAGRFGDDVVRQAYVLAIRTDAIDGIQQATGVDVKTLSSEWHAAIAREYAPILQGRRDGHVGLRTVIAGDDENPLNISPSVSPDGTRLVFLSTRDRLSIDLFVADTATGRIVRKLSETATDPHLDSLQFVNGSGAWAPDGERFAYTDIRQGQPAITIVDTRNGDVESRRRFDALGEILHLAWSPDGRQLAVAALQAGQTDLFLVDVESGALSALTDDLFLDLQPTWSPDGRELAFVSDRFSSQPAQSAYGAPRLVRLTVASKQIVPIEVPGEGRHANPQWSADGRITFIADPQGVADVFRWDPASGITALTGLPTGASGITAMSPALAVATRTGQVFFTLFLDGTYSIVALPEEPRAVTTTTAARAPAITLPPTGREPGPVAELLASPRQGLPPATAEPVTTDYSPRLGLEFAGNTGIGVGTSRFGPQVQGGIAFQFSDMLGDHTVIAGAQVSGRIRDIGGQLGYLNRQHRIGWGGIVEQIPYVTGAFRQGIGVDQGQPVFVDEVIELRQTHRQALGIVEYPFSRAQRLEFSAGARNIGFEARSFRTIYDLETGAYLRDREEELEGFGGSVTLGEFSTALVYDTAVNGPTSPLMGRRYRLELAPTVGDLRLNTVLGDYREYWMPFRPFTIAARGLFYGRFGRDAEDVRLTPLFLGYSTFVRGYGYDSFEVTDCSPTIDGSCPEFDRLIGSRMVVGNLELRFPLFGAFRGELDYGPIPVEGLLFADAGLAWTKDENPSFADGTRDWARSVGAGVRVNALGFAVLEFAAVRPLDRPARNWMFVFSLQPGF